MEFWTVSGTLRFVGGQMLGPPFFKSGGVQSANTFHQILCIAGVELAIPRTRDSGSPCRFLGVRGNVRNGHAKQLREHEADFILCVRLRGGIVEDRRNETRIDPRWGVVNRRFWCTNTHDAQRMREFAGLRQSAQW